MSRLDMNVVDPRSSSYNKLIVVDEDDIVKSVGKVELRAQESVVVTANEGSIILDPCVIHGDESVVLQGKKGVAMKDICVTSVSRKGSRNPFYSKQKKVIEEVSETTCITSGGDISIISSEGTIVTSGIDLTSNGGRILQSGRDGVYNLSAVSKTSINEKVRVLGGLSKEQRKEKHEVETPCVFESAEGIYVESEKGSIVNIGVIVTGNGVCSFKAGENVLFERRILKHEVSVKKQGFDLSVSILGVDIFESSSSFFENLKLEFLENHLPPIGNSPVEVARSIREGNVPEIAANIVNTLLIPGNLRFILDAPVKFGLKFNDYELHHHKYDSLGEGKVETDYLFVSAADTVEFSNAFGFNAGSVEIEAHKLIEHGAFLKYELENFSSGFGIGFEPFGGDLFQCVPSLSVDLSIAKESCSIAVCQVGNTSFMNVNVEEWEKYGSQTFGETVQGRVGTISFDSTSTVTEGKMHGISLGTTSLGLSDGHSKSSLIADQTGIYAVNVDDFHVKTVQLKSSRCPVRGTEATEADESMEFEKVSGTSLGVDFYGFLSISGMAFAAKNCGGKQISKLKGVGIEKRDYVAVVENSFENVNESDFHYRSIDLSSQSDAEREAMSEVETVHQNYKTLTRDDNSLFVKDNGESDEESVVNRRSALLTPMKTVLKDRGFKLKFHYDRTYHVMHEGIEKMHKEVVDEGLLPCLEGAAFGDVDPQHLYPVLEIFYDPLTSELDKYAQMLFYRDGEKTKFCDLSESEKQEVFIYQSYLQNGGDFRDYVSLCNFYEEKKQGLSDEYAKKSMKEYVRETYPELYLSTGLHEVQNVEDVQRIFMDIKFAYEPDDPMVRQLTFEMNQYYAEQIFNASWAELSSTQQKEIVKIREHALIYQQTDQEVDFGEYLHEREAQFVDYFANHHQEPDTNVLTSFGVLPVELLKEPDPILSECMPYQALQFDNERKYPAPGSGLFFLPAAPEASGWEGICEYGSTIKNCIRDHFLHFLAGRPEIDYQPSQIEVFRDKSLRRFFSRFLDFVPYVNGAKWSYQGISGFNPITKDRLDWKERVRDLTFSMFYFQPLANVITGYGKGAVLEPLRGAWMAGKIIIKDRTLKGVFETMKITGSAAIESISVPTQHLGAFLEMKMMWGVNSGAASFRNAGAWFSNKMESWKSGFWSRWNWSRKHFDVVRFTYSFETKGLAFAGGSPITRNGFGGRAHNKPFVMSANQSQTEGIAKVENGPDFLENLKKELAKDAAREAKVAKSRIRKKRKSYTRLSWGYRKLLISIISKELYAKALTLGNAEIRKLPVLKHSDCVRIANEFNGKLSPRVRNFTRTPELVSMFRSRNGEAIVKKVRELCESNPKDDGLAGLKNVGCLSNNRLPKGGYTSFLIDCIAKQYYMKLLEVGNAEIRQLPTLAMSDYGEIANRFNNAPRVIEKQKRVSKTPEQVKVFRSRFGKDIVQRVKDISTSNPQDGLRGLQCIGRCVKSGCRSEHSIVLLDIISRDLYSKMKKLGDPEIRQLPTPTWSDYERMAELFNAKPKVNGSSKTAEQVKQFRRFNGEDIVQKVKELSAANPKDGLRGLQCIGRACKLPDEYLDILIDSICKEIYSKLLKLGGSKGNTGNNLRKKSRKLPTLSCSDYEGIAKRFNAEMSVRKKPRYFRTAEQIKAYRCSVGEVIVQNVKKMINSSSTNVDADFTGLVVGEVGSQRIGVLRQLPDEYSEILLDLVSNKIYAKIVESGNPRTRRLSTLNMSDYRAIARRFNVKLTRFLNSEEGGGGGGGGGGQDLLNKNRELKRTAEQVQYFRKDFRKEIVEKVQSISTSNPQDGLQGLQSLGHVHLLPDEYADFLVELISKSIQKKLQVQQRNNNDQHISNMMKVVLEEGNTSSNSCIRVALDSNDIKVISKIYHADERVVKNPKYARSDKQIWNFKRAKRLEILNSMVRRINGLDDSTLLQKK